MPAPRPGSAAERRERPLALIFTMIVAVEIAVIAALYLLEVTFS